MNKVTFRYKPIKAVSRIPNSFSVLGYTYYRQIHVILSHYLKPITPYEIELTSKLICKVISHEQFHLDIQRVEKGDLSRLFDSIANKDEYEDMDIF